MINSIIIMTVSLLASVAGAVCGIGGGVIIKPALDSLGIMSVDTVSFLSGCTVMSMSGYSVIRAIYKKELNIRLKTGVPISAGAAAGGILGRYLFHLLNTGFLNTDYMGAVQAVCLFWLTFATLLYTINRRKIKTNHISKSLFCMLAGLMLGLASSFLGIGGGPFNLVLLSFMFSMEPKEAAQNSLFIIFFAQISSLSLTLSGGNIPVFNLRVLIGMALAGIAGAIIGRKVNKIIKEETVDKLFRGLNFIIMIICVYNFCKYLCISPFRF